MQATEQEPLPGQLAEPRTWHRYAYAFANPINYRDPYGLQTCGFDITTGQRQCFGEATGMGRTMSIPALISAMSIPALPRGAFICSSASSINPSPPGPITRFIRQVIPGTAQQWSTFATELDIVALFFDIYSAAVVTYGGIAGAGIPAALLPEGIPEVPIATGLAGMGIAELYVQPLIRTANILATISSAATAIADVKAGYTNIEEGVVGMNTKNSLMITFIGWNIPEAYLSTLLQALAVTNDLGWTSVPFPPLNWGDNPIGNRGWR